MLRQNSLDAVKLDKFDLTALVDGGGNGHTSYHEIRTKLGGRGILGCGWRRGEGVGGGGGGGVSAVFRQDLMREIREEEPCEAYISTKCLQTLDQGWPHSPSERRGRPAKW